ncbi:UNVERIFIED_CONTAM: hypothetical protein PYX00_005605 [Menopon gallinae]|uniref:Protein quiver n=1 Tax=Menopon gallinae TaxID=328185 RepID=A0AAW2HS35_9NEOP
MASLSLQLKCYQCRSDEHTSLYPEANSYPVCKPNISDSFVVELTNLAYPRCKKLVETVKDSVDGKEKTLIIRTGVKSPDTIAPNTDIKEYTCEKDFCNSGYVTQAAIALLFPVVAAALIR